MKWFKHSSTESTSIFLSKLQDEFGAQGYAWWFLLLELCSEQYNGDIQETFVFHKLLVKNKLRTTMPRLRRFLEYCQTEGQLQFNCSSTVDQLQFNCRSTLLEIKISKLRESFHKDSVSSKARRALDIDTDLDKEKYKYTSASRTLVCSPEFGRIKERYPSSIHRPRIQEAMVIIYNQLSPDWSWPKFQLAVSNYAAYCDKNGVQRQHVLAFYNFCREGTWVEWAELEIEQKRTLWVGSTEYTVS